ncbi:MAG TPA: benzoylformate decarboxylase [Steroidobacteraceae bacterium]|nr:benzoylformate decarboxylase [Steroidobacteraceae bacterium]
MPESGGSKSSERTGRTGSQVSVREAVFSLLRAFNLTTIFGNPGSTELPMFRDFPSDFRYVLGLQESIALGMADGYAQATGNAAFVNLHSAVGVGHALGNLFTAYRNQTPLVITAGQQARSILPFEPFLYATQPTEFPKPYVKWSVEPARAEDVPAAIARAYYTAMQAPRGPTFVSVPVDDWDRTCEPVTPRQVSRSVLGDPALLAAAAEALNTAHRPAIVVGAGVARDDAWAETIALAQHHQAPVWVSPMSGRNSFPENHALFAGFLAADRARIVASLKGSDFILVLGAPAFTYHVEGFGAHVPEGARLVQLIDDPSIAAWTPTGVSIVTNLKLGVQALLDAAAPRRRRAPEPRAAAPRVPRHSLTDRFLMQQIAALRAPDSIIVEEAPSTRGPMHDYLPILEQNTFYTCASGGLGHGLPAAVGVALARPDKRVIAVLGDGSSLYSIQGLWSAAQLKLPIAFVIVKNGTYEALYEFSRHFKLERPQGSDLPDIDFCSLARAQGLAALRVEKATELDRALTTAFQSAGPILVEVVVERGAGSTTEGA